MALEDVAPVLAREFVTLKLDYDRAEGAKDIVVRYAGKSQGIPWFAFLDGEGKAIVTSSDAAKGNVGMPWAPHEVEHFAAMLKRAQKHLTDQQIAGLITSIQDFRKKAEAK